MSRSPAADSASWQHVARISVPEGHGFVAGAVSPDGRWLAYSLTPKENVGIWLADLSGDGETRALLPADRKRLELAWSPDGTRLAYWIGEGRHTGLWTVAAADGDERRVWRPDGGDVFPSAPAWIGERLAFNRNSLEGMNAIDELWVLEPDGRAGPLDLGPNAGTRISASPGGGRVAAFGYRCCGGAGMALYVREMASGETRCVAGPLTWSDLAPVWSRDEETIWFVGGPRRDVADLFAVDVRGGGARRIATPGDSILTISGDREGHLYVITRDGTGGPIDLWRYRGAHPAAEGEPEIAACPEPDARVRAFVAAEKLPDVHSISEIVHDEAHEVSVFAVSFGAEQDWNLYSGGVGIVTRHGGAWLSRDRLDVPAGQSPDIPPYVIPADEPWLLSREFLERMNAAGLGEGWRQVLVRTPATPYALLTGLADTMVVSRPWAALALLEKRPEFAEDVPRLVRLARAAQRPGESPARNAAGQLLWKIGPRVAADPHATPEALQLLSEMLEDRRGDPLAPRIAAALVAHAGASRDPDALVRLARDLPARDPSAKDAARRLFRDSATPDSLLGHLAEKFGPDSAMAAEMIRAAPVRASGAALAWLMSPRVRWDVRAQAMELALANPHVSEPALLAVANVVEQSDYALRRKLLDHPVTQRSLRVPATLLRRFAVFSMLRREPEARSLDDRARALLAARVTDPALGEAELLEVAQLIGVTDNTTVMMKMLENPVVRRCEGILQWFVISQRTYSNPAMKPVPPPEEVVRRANALIASLRADPGHRECNPEPVVTAVQWSPDD
jgi:hypothetical protein